MSFLSAALAAGGQLLGGLISNQTQKKINDKNLSYNREVLQNQIQWKVDDAKKAGIHPLYALGAPSVSPGALASDNNSFGNSVSGASNVIARSLELKQSKLLDAQIKKTEAEAYEAKARAHSIIEDAISGSAMRMLSDSLRGLKPRPQTLPGHEPMNVSGEAHAPVVGPAGISWREKPLRTRGQFWEDNYGDVGSSVVQLLQLLEDLDWTIQNNWYDFLEKKGLKYNRGKSDKVPQLIIEKKAR